MEQSKLGGELAYVIRGYLVDPQEITDDWPAWDQMLQMINQILRNPLFPNFGDLDLRGTGEGEAVITDATGLTLARVIQERRGRVRTIPLDV